MLFIWCRRRCYLKQDLAECQIGGQSKKHEEEAHAQACARHVSTCFVHFKVLALSATG
jgi:hypothetical protein